MYKFTNNYPEKFPLLYKQLIFPKEINNIVMDYIAYDCFSNEEIIEIYPTKLTTDVYEYLMKNNPKKLSWHMKHGNVSHMDMLYAAYNIRDYNFARTVMKNYTNKYGKEIIIDRSISQLLIEKDIIDEYSEYVDGGHFVEDIDYYISDRYHWRDALRGQFDCAIDGRFDIEKIEITQGNIAIPKYNFILDNMDEVIRNICMIWATYDIRTISFINKYQTVTNELGLINTIDVFDIVIRQHVEPNKLANYIYDYSIACNNRPLMEHVVKYIDEIIFFDPNCESFNECCILAMDHNLGIEREILDIAILFDELHFVIQHYEKGNMKSMILYAVQNNSINVFEFLIYKIGDVPIDLIKSICDNAYNSYDIINYIVEKKWHHLREIRDNKNNPDINNLIDHRLVR